MYLSQGKWWLKGTPLSPLVFLSEPGYPTCAAPRPLQHCMGLPSLCTKRVRLSGTITVGLACSQAVHRIPFNTLICSVSVGEETGNLLGPLYFTLQCGTWLDCWMRSVMHSAIKHLSARKSLRKKWISLHLCAINGWHFRYGGAICRQSEKNLESCKRASYAEHRTRNQQALVLISLLPAVWHQQGSIFSRLLFTPL